MNFKLSFQGNASTKLWSQQDLTDQQMNQEFQAIYDEQDRYFQKLGDAFVDPDWETKVRSLVEIKKKMEQRKV